MNNTGTVKWYNNKKGYGFISGNDGEDVFVHHSQIKEEGNEKSLHEGENITYDTVTSDKGLQAINVQRM